MSTPVIVVWRQEEFPQAATVVELDGNELPGVQSVEVRRAVNELTTVVITFVAEYHEREVAS